MAVVFVGFGVRVCGCKNFNSRTVSCVRGWLFAFDRLQYWFLFFAGLLHCWHVGLGFSEFLVAYWCTQFTCSSSGASKVFSSNSPSKCMTVCLYVPFCKWAWFIDFFRCGGFLAFMNCSTIAKQQFRMPLGPIFHIQQKSPLIFVLMFSGLNLEYMFCSHWLRFHVSSTENLLQLLLISLGLGC